MNKTRKKALKAEVKSLSSKQKTVLIMHLLGQIERMKVANNLQFEIMNSMVDSKAANVSGSMQ